MSRTYIFTALQSVLLCVLSSCAYWSIPGKSSERSEYERWVDHHLVEDRVYERFQNTLAVKVLPVTRELVKLQKDLGIDEANSLQISDQFAKVLVAVNARYSEQLTARHIQVSWGAIPGRIQKEITDPVVLRSFYSFTRPWFRLVEVDFPKANLNQSETISVQIPGARVQIAPRVN